MVSRKIWWPNSKIFCQFFCRGKSTIPIRTRCWYIDTTLTKTAGINSVLEIWIIGIMKHLVPKYVQLIYKRHFLESRYLLQRLSYLAKTRRQIQDWIPSHVVGIISSCVIKYFLYRHIHQFMQNFTAWAQIHLGLAKDYFEVFGAGWGWDILILKAEVNSILQES